MLIPLFAALQMATNTPAIYQEYWTNYDKRPVYTPTPYITTGDPLINVLPVPEPAPVEFDWSKPRTIDNEVVLPVLTKFEGGEYCDFEPRPTGLAFAKIMDDVLYTEQKYEYFHLHKDVFPNIIEDLRHHETR